MLSAAVLAGGPLVVSGDTRAFAAAQNAPVKLTAAQMLGRQQVAVAVIAKSYTALPKEARGRSAPFLKGLIDVANAYRDLAAATRARDNRKTGAALPKVATSLAKLNSAYQLSGIRDPKIASSLKSLNGLWKTYLKAVNVGAPRWSQKQATASARKINHMRRELLGRNASQKGDRRAAAQRAHLLALLREADAATRQADQLWYASMLMAEIYGYYAGVYEFYSAYEPAYAADYRESWQSISIETRYFYRESVSYYEEYTWSSYEETIEVSESYEFGLTEAEFTAVETEVETSGVSVGEVENLYQSSEERRTLDGVETQIDVEEAIATEPAEPDAAMPDAEDGQPVNIEEAPQTDDGAADQRDDAGAQADEPAPDEDVCAGDNPPESCAVAVDTGAGQGEAMPGDLDGQLPDEVVPEDQTQDEVLPDDGGAMDEGAVDDGAAALDDGAGQSDESGDVCAGDNPPADCFANDESATGNEDPSGQEGGDVCAGDNPTADCFANDESATGDEGSSSQEGGGDDQTYDEPAGDDAAAQDESGGGEDYSGGDDSGGGESFDEE